MNLSKHSNLFSCFTIEYQFLRLLCILNEAIHLLIAIPNWLQYRDIYVYLFLFKCIICLHHSLSLIFTCLLLNFSFDQT